MDLNGDFMKEVLNVIKHTLKKHQHYSKANMDCIKSMLEEQVEDLEPRWDDEEVFFRVFLENLASYFKGLKDIDEVLDIDVLVDKLVRRLFKKPPLAKTKFGRWFLKYEQRILAITNSIVTIVCTVIAIVFSKQ